MRETELRLQKEIKEVEGRLQKEIEGIRLEIKQVEVQIQQVEVRFTAALHRQTLWLIGAIGAVTGLVRLLDHFLK